MAPTPPITVAEFKARFVRDFQYGTGPDKVMDSDITVAMTDTLPMFNPSLFSSADGKTAFLYATAHFLVTNVRAAGGLSAGPSRGLGMNNVPIEISTGAGVGGVSDSFASPPEFVTRSPMLQQFWTTSYGRNYVAMVAPRIVGPFGAVGGRHEIDTEHGDTPNVPYTEGS